HAALLPEHRIAVDVQAIEHEIVRHLRQIGLRRVAGAQRDDVAGAALIGEKLQEHQLPVVGGRGGLQRRTGIGRLEDRIFGSRVLYAGVMRMPGDGSAESGAPERIVMKSLMSPLFGSTKFPAYVAPGSSVMTSPGCAAF